MLESLDPGQLQQCHAALLAAFPTQHDLHRLVRAVLRLNLESLVEKNPLKAMVFDLIEWAETNGKLEDLICGAQTTNPDNPKLQAFVEQVGLDTGPTAALTTQIIEPATPTMDTFPKWRSLLTDLESGQCLPILGPCLLEPLIGAPRDLAHNWIKTFNLPGPAQLPDELPQVAQFLATIENPNMVRIEYRKYWSAQLAGRHREQVPDLDRTTPLDEQLQTVAAAYWAETPPDPYRLLAALPCPIYLSANPDTLLLTALRVAGKQPQVELCRWIEGDQRWPPPLSETAPDYQPSVHRPLVYYLFGTLAQPFSLVLKEDDYFDYLVGVTALKRQVPSAVRFALTESALLFLGFQLDDWGFRVLFRNILGQGATARREQHPHVAVQLDPDSPEQPSSVRRYLQNYFASADVTVYWGRVEQFLQEFAANWARYQTEEGTG